MGRNTMPQGGVLAVLGGGAQEAPEARSTETAPTPAPQRRTAAERPARPAQKRPVASETKPEPKPREKITGEIPSELAALVRGCVDYLGGGPPQGERLTLNEFVEAALRRELAHREKKHGVEFTPLERRLRVGRKAGRSA